MSGPFGPDRPDEPESGSAEERPRIPPPRAAAEDRGPLPDPESVMPPAPPSLPQPTPLPVPPEPEVPAQKATPVIPFDHKILKSLLGAWALSACSVEEAAAVEAHLTDCAMCADEAVRLRDAVGLLHKEDNLDLDPMLRTRTLAGCLGRRPARIPVPEWAAPYDAETARLDALLNDMGESEWRTPVRLRWYEGSRGAEREATVAAVLAHLMAVDGAVAVALGLADPLSGLGEFAGPGSPPASPTSRTEAYWRSEMPEPPGSVRDLWRDQARAMVRTVGFAGGPAAEQQVPYGEFGLPLRDSFLDRAFECWMHAWDIAEAVDYPYEPPAAAHLHLMIDLAVRLLPETLAGRRRVGLAGPVHRLGAAGKPGRTLHLEVEGKGGGHWFIPLDSPGAAATPEEEVARVALDATEFCQLAAGHILPEDAAAGQDGDREAIREVLSAAAALSRL
ncbi:maleylpyruvate isomerase family mycothiol-dependent enzyme [Streptomyces sp. NPDC048639]|uniref:maleylpyruvate isomerase family mycothiol-dependent enzyme n=1 Tax=Streptomyces sp. NPDC048639 TaxID=3365581 RepID=UPI00371914BF